MNLWNWLRRTFNRQGKAPPRASMEMYEETIHVGQQDLTDLICEIAEQEQRSPEDVASEIFSHTREEYEHFDKKLAKWHTLSPREQEVAALACLGYTNEDIAQKLFISPNTVKVHIRNSLFKFSAHSKEHLRQILKGMDFSAFDT